MSQTREMIFLLVGLAAGAGTVQTDNYFRPANRVWRYAFNQTINGEMSLAVKPSGKIEFGPAFSADKSLQALLDGLKEIRRIQFCGPFKEAALR